VIIANLLERAAGACADHAKNTPGDNENQSIYSTWGVRREAGEERREAGGGNREAGIGSLRGRRGGRKWRPSIRMWAVMGKLLASRFEGGWGLKIDFGHTCDDFETPYSSNVLLRFINLR